MKITLTAILTPFALISCRLNEPIKNIIHVHQCLENVNRYKRDLNPNSAVTIDRCLEDLIALSKKIQDVVPILEQAQREYEG